MIHAARRIAWTCVAGLAFAAGAGAAGAGAAGSAMPPEARESGAVTAAAQSVRRDIERLAASPPAPTRDASLALRRVAFDLLARGNEAPDDAQAMAVAGLRLAKSCAMLDALLASAESERQMNPAVRAALERFARAAEHGLDVPPPPAEPERALRELLAPLREAVASLEAKGPGTPGAPPATPPPTAWPAEPELGPGSTGASPDAGAQPPDAQDQGDADRARVTAMKRWPDDIAAMNAPSRERFAALTKQWAANLKLPAQQASARMTIDRFARELETFRTLPLEAGLRASSPAASEAALGRGTELLRAIDRQRKQWIKAWSDGRGTPEATGAMLRLARVMAALEASNALAPRLGGARDLERWGGWSCAVNDLALHPKAISGRGALALEAVLAGDAAGADAQLAKLDDELPLAWFVALLAERVAPWAAPRPALGSVLAAAVDAPARESWMGARRAEWALIGRLAAEEAHARLAGNAPLASMLRAELASRAANLAPLIHRDGAAATRMAEIARALGTRSP